jgi:DNA adenine methylase
MPAGCLEETEMPKLEVPDARVNRRLADRTLTPPLKTHGGKSYLAKRIVALMPPRVHYVEPFFGGGAVLLAKNPENVSECVNDLDGGLTNFWRVLQNSDQCLRFRRLCADVPFSEAEWHAAADRLDDPDPVLRAVAFFVRCRQSLAGRGKSFAPLSRTRTRRGMNEQVSAWLGAVDWLWYVHWRLKRVAIVGPKPALEVIREQDGLATLFYLDPPYLHSTRTAPVTYGPFEMTEADHAELIDALRRVEGKAMLSGYRSELYDRALVDWSRHDFELPNNAAGGATKRRMTECVWCNF